MALQISDRLITSDTTPETARYVTTFGGWALSWLPGGVLTREQAVSGMVLDETLSDPDAFDSELAMELAAVRASDLGISLAEAVIRLYARIIGRDRQQCAALLLPIAVTTHSMG